MPSDRFAFRIPLHCPNCRSDRIRLGQTINGRVVHLIWQCSNCQYEWQLSPTEQGDRRTGERRLTMRKRVPPKDRRTA